MPADRDPPGLIDYVVSAISPLLVMLTVGSLVFFLVEVLYAGQYTERLLYTLFFYVGGSVLVARIAITIDTARAAGYGLALAVVAAMALAAYVDYSGSPLGRATWAVNLGLLGLIWWTTNKLTWDCTHLDGKDDVSGRGLLSAAAPFSRDPQASGPDDAREGKKRKKQGAWLWRWWSHESEKAKKPHTPGVWVVYFTLAALPLFAVGQSLIPPDDADRRRATFLQMAGYIVGTLGLLVTTTLMGLRRYLRQRKAKFPASLAARWLGLGAGLVVVFLVVGAVLPRPHSETPLVNLDRFTSADRDASEYAQLNDGAGKGEGADGEESEKGEGNASGKGGDPGGSKGEKGGGGKGDKGKGGSGKDGKSSGGGKDKGGKSGSDGKSGGKDKGGDSSADKNESKDGGRSGDTTREAKEARNKAAGNKSGRSRPPNPSSGGALEKMAGIAKWIVIALVVVVVIVVVVLAVLNYLAPFTGWARRLLDALRNWWASLFGRGGRSAPSEGPSEQTGPVRPPPFTAFSNPFEDGTAPGRDPAELVRYTFAALDAWAWDRGHGRRPEETPLEFADRLGEAVPDRKPAVRRLAGRFARVEYSDADPPADTLEVLEHVWDDLVHGAGVAEVEDIGV